jgi:DNA polymerase I
MELDLEGFYPRGIFVSKKDGTKGAKKKYALLNEAGKINITGFETIRGDWSVLAKEVQHRVFELILKENDKVKAVQYVKDIIKDIRDRKIPLEKMIMGRQLRKDLSEYEAVGPHVAVAKIMQQRGLHVGPGTFVQYIVNEGKGIIRDRAKLPEDSKNYDVEYYIGHQVLPAVDKIMEVLGYTKKDLSEGNSQSTLGDY